MMGHDGQYGHDGNNEQCYVVELPLSSCGWVRVRDHITYVLATLINTCSQGYD